MWTKCLIGLTGAALGLWLGMVIRGQAAPDSAPPAAVPPAPDVSDRIESLQARIRENEKELEALRALSRDPGEFSQLEEFAAIVYDRSLAVAEKARRIARLKEPQRSKALLRLGPELGARPDLHDEILQALKEESSAEVLAVLADLLKCGAWRKPTPAEIDALEALYRESENPDRRAAVLPALSLAYLDRRNPHWLEFAAEIVRTESSPRVLGRLADSCMDVDELASDPSVRARLEETLPNLRGDPGYASVLTFLQISKFPSARTADLQARWEKETDPKTRAQIVKTFIDLGQRGYLSAGGRQTAPGATKKPRADATPMARIMDMYRGTEDRKDRIRLIALSPRLLPGHPWDDVLAEFAAREASPALRERIQRLRRAMESGEMRRPGSHEVRRFLSGE